MRIYSSEITVILGAYSSGKTTFLRTIANWNSPDAGNVQFFNNDVEINWRAKHYSLDVCWANNHLFDLLTVGETLTYFINIKQPDLNEEFWRMQLFKWTELLKPVIPNTNVLAKSLNFQQGRFLVLACVMCCRTKIVLLDNPTLHMRRWEQLYYWSILQQEKIHRAIILTTFFSEEAELVGDRIAIINKGMIMAYGTPFFIKTKFNITHNLIITKKASAAVPPISVLIRSLLPSANLNVESETQLRYKIAGEKRPIYQKLLINLEKERTALGIEKIRLLSSELNSAFEAIGLQETQPKIPKCSQMAKMHGELKNRKQIGAMFFKKLLHQAPNIIPVVMLFVGFLLIFLIGDITKLLKPVESLKNEMLMGFSSIEDRDSILTDKNVCDILAISSVQIKDKKHEFTPAQSRIFNENSLVCGDGKFSDYEKSMSKITSRYGAMERNSTHIYVNQLVFHSAPLALNLYHNYLLLYHSNSTFADYSVHIYNDPLPAPYYYKIKLAVNQLMHISLPLTVGIIMPITISCFIFLLMEEKRSHMYTLQIIAGLKVWIYWLVTFIWDYLTFLAYSIIFVIVMSLSSIEGFNIFSKILVLLLLNVYGASALLMTYCISLFINQTPGIAFLISILIQLITGLCSYVVYWNILDSGVMYFYIAELFPSFALLDGIGKIYVQYKQDEQCRKRCNAIDGCSLEHMCATLKYCCASTYFSFSQKSGISLPIFFMILSAFIFLIIMIIVHLMRQQRKYQISDSIKEMHSVTYPFDDREVVELRTRIAEMDTPECKRMRVLVDQLEDHILKKSETLRTTSFVVDKSSSLGILGTRHCGKTNLCEKLVGEKGFKFGDVFIAGYEMKRDLKSVHKEINYCPQDYGLFRVFTPRELMRLLFIIRGIAPGKIRPTTQDIAELLNMRMLLDKKIGTLTAEKRRKVNIALAMVAYNNIIILDEPVRGMSAAVRIDILNALSHLKSCGKTLIFTSSDTYVCEYLADTVILFQDGEMWGIGDIQHLRDKFTRGFYLEVKLKRDGTTAEETELNFRKDIDNLHRFVTFLHERSELISRTDNWLKFYIPVENVIYSYLFGSLEKNKKRLNIVDYCVNQGSITDAFRNIAAVRYASN